MTGTDYARAVLGHPWQSGATGPSAFDCWGLVRDYYRSVLADDLPVVDVDALAPLAVRREFADAAHRHGWQACQDGLDHAAVLMGKTGRPAHVGVWIHGAVLHCVQGAGVIWQRPLQLKLAGWNLLGSFRRIG